MTPKELKAEIERLDRLIDHARGIRDDPNHRNELPPVVEQLAHKLAQSENDRQKLWAGLTTEERMVLRDEIHPRDRRAIRHSVKQRIQRASDRKLRRRFADSRNVGLASARSAALFRLRSMDATS